MEAKITIPAILLDTGNFSSVRLSIQCMTYPQKCFRRSISTLHNSAPSNTNQQRNRMMGRIKEYININVKGWQTSWEQNACTFFLWPDFWLLTSTNTLILIVGTAMSIAYRWPKMTQHIVINLIPWTAWRVSSEVFVLSNFLPLLHTENASSSSFLCPAIKSALMILSFLCYWLIHSVSIMSDIS
jgi:hypothetical protein